jgi:signal transduction histidine kinase
VASGWEALESVKRSNFDLVLVDAMMPRMDGFEVVRRLKEIAGTEFLPVVIVTALSDRSARLRALEAGAEDFLEKPVSAMELRARVRKLIHLRITQRALAAQNAQLRALQAFKDEMAALLVHDLKSPLSALTMNLEVALESLPREESRARDALLDCRTAGARLFRMLANLLDIARSEEGRLVAKCSPLDVSDLLSSAIRERALEAEARSIAVEARLPPILPADVDVELFGRIVENLLDNALRFTRPRGKILVVADADAENGIQLRIANDGPEIPPDSRTRIFEKYDQAAASSRTNHGLGLYFCRLAAEAHGGSIELCAEPDYTTCFRVRIPARPADVVVAVSQTIPSPRSVDAPQTVRSCEYSFTFDQARP